ncbi:hypothetical protein CROQUDRAFT_726329 [Cronartium quercuum f. sp. fusiforme G11]|uniref:Uncharacterized protein n=1 Tax=Cronartium quercuum f. sp. fusiforme G11 TaxID=708437 RepID=A0A9P6T737_9BASI|nr:hypothetical protein CROQUDRAFT_726329 [Cronartium quercuum f. sp. fusiforme G11]
MHVGFQTLQIDEIKPHSSVNSGPKTSTLLVLTILAHSQTKFTSSFSSFQVVYQPTRKHHRMGYFYKVDRPAFSLGFLLTGNSTYTATNPFQKDYDAIKSNAFPTLPSWAYPILIIFAIWRGLVMLSCIAIFVIPLHKGRASRKKHLWLIRRRFDCQDKKKAKLMSRCHASGTGMIPFLVPNRCMVMAISEFVCNGLYLALACVNYLVRSYVGIWVAGWALSYACLCDLRGDGRNRAARILNPLVFNFTWLTWSVLTVGVNIYWAILVRRAEYEFKGNAIRLLQSLRMDSRNWKLDQDFSEGKVLAILAQEEEVRELSILIAKRLRNWSITWIVLGVVLALFYIFTLQYLWKMARKLLVVCDSEALTCRQASPSLFWEEIRQELWFLFKSCVVISLVLFCELTVAVYQIGSSFHLESALWRTTSALVAQVPGMMMSPILLFQSWRIFSERSLDESILKEAHQNIPNLPGFASQLLGWTTADYWAKEVNLNIENFPGLRAIETENLSYEEGIPTSSHPDHTRILPIDVKITRSITTTINKL